VQRNGAVERNERQLKVAINGRKRQQNDWARPYKQSNETDNQTIVTNLLVIDPLARYL
jgi:hypothetical protein